MKHIKKYNNFSINESIFSIFKKKDTNKENYNGSYEKIPSSLFHNITYVNSPVFTNRHAKDSYVFTDFSENELGIGIADKIKKILIQNKIKKVKYSLEETDTYHSGSVKYMVFNYLSINGYKSNLIVYKLNDDYFLVNIVNFSDYNDMPFICDGEDGLYACLNNEVK